MTYKIEIVSIYIQLSNNRFARNIDYYADDGIDHNMNILDIDADGDIIGIEAIISGDEFFFNALDRGNRPHSLGTD